MPPERVSKCVNLGCSRRALGAPRNLQAGKGRRDFHLLQSEDANRLQGLRTDSPT